MYYWWSYFRAVLPGMLWMSACALPPLAGLVIARREIRHGDRSSGAVFAAASLASGLTTLLIVGPFLWGVGSGSSTDSLIWVWAPIASTVVLAVAVAVGRIIIRRVNRSSQAIRSSTPVNAALLGPAAVVACVLLVTIVSFSFRNGGMTVAQHVSDPDVLRQLYLREGAASSSSGVQLFLAGNRATPGDVLDALSRSDFAHVRVHVAANTNTPPSARMRLAADTNSNVRSSARRQQRRMP